MRKKTRMYDTRKNGAIGIQWRGWLYESSPVERKVGDRDRRVMIIEDHGDYLLVSNYEFDRNNMSTACYPVGPLHRVNRIAPGRPTMQRIDSLKTAISQANELLRERQANVSTGSF